MKCLTELEWRFHRAIKVHEEFIGTAGYLATKKSKILCEGPPNNLQPLNVQLPRALSEPRGPRRVQSFKFFASGYDALFVLKLVNLENEAREVNKYEKPYSILSNEKECPDLVRNLTNCKRLLAVPATTNLKKFHTIGVVNLSSL